MMQEWADFLEETQRGGKVLAFRSDVAWSIHRATSSGFPDDAGAWLESVARFVDAPTA